MSFDIGQVIDLQLDDISTSATYTEMVLVSVTYSYGVRTFQFESKARWERKHGVIYRTPDPGPPAGRTATAGTGE